MNIRELKELIKDLPDDLEVMIPVCGVMGELDEFISPCPQASFPVPLHNDDDLEDTLILAPCGFYDEPEYPEVPPTLN